MTFIAIRRSIVKEVKKRAENLLGAPYNASFYPDGDGYYCSQFIAELLPIFETIPMKFGDEEAGD